jgi:hypothetical protein
MNRVQKLVSWFDGFYELDEEEQTAMLERLKEQSDLIKRIALASIQQPSRSNVDSTTQSSDDAALFLGVRGEGATYPLKMVPLASPKISIPIMPHGPTLPLQTQMGKQAFSTEGPCVGASPRIDNRSSRAKGHVLGDLHLQRLGSDSFMAAPQIDTGSPMVAAATVQPSPLHPIVSHVLPLSTPRDLTHLERQPSARTPMPPPHTLQVSPMLMSVSLHPEQDDEDTPTTESSHTPL